MHLYRHHTFVWEKCWEFQTTSPLKPLGQCCSNFMWSLLGLREWKIAKMVAVHWSRWPPCPYIVKTFKNLLLQNRGCLGAESAQIIRDGRSTKIAKMMVVQRLLKWSVHWPRWLPCPYMVKTFKNLLLQNKISPGALSLHKSSGTGDLPKLLKWWSYFDIWPFYGKVKFASHAFVWALYIYMGKMLRIHILDISSIIQLNRSLMMSIREHRRHKIPRSADRKSKVATTAAILKISFRHLFSNLRLLWAKTCSLATGWLLDQNKLKLCQLKIQDDHNGSAPLNKIATRAKKYKIFKRHLGQWPDFKIRGEFNKFVELRV